MPRLLSNRLSTCTDKRYIALRGSQALVVSVLVDVGGQPGGCTGLQNTGGGVHWLEGG